jgi:multiple sugar transport system ATP-binding protein
MTLGDRVAVMRAGVLQQVGSPAELYADPTNIFVAGFIGSPAMNFMTATITDGRVRLPFGEISLPEELRAAGSRSGRVVAGIRPESFEDASLVGEARDRGATFTATIDLVESMGSEQYAYFRLEDEGVESDELRELAEDAGTTEVPSSGEGNVVARLDAVSPVRRGQQTELWVDTSKLHLFDPETGRSLKRQRQEPQAQPEEPAQQQAQEPQEPQQESQ